MRTFHRQSGLVALLVTTLLLPAGSPAQETEPDAADILRTILLPRVAEVLRDQGVPTEEVREVVTSARDQGVPPAEATEVLEATVLVVEEEGPIENFGSFVQARLQEGLRGRALAEAIRAEHAARGIGKGNRLDNRRGPGVERGGPNAERGGPPGNRGQSGASRRGGGA